MNRARFVALGPLGFVVFALVNGSEACGGAVTSTNESEAGADAQAEAPPSGSGGMSVPPSPPATSPTTPSPSPSPTTTATPTSPPPYDTSVVTVPCPASGFVDGGPAPACPPPPAPRCLDSEWLLSYAPLTLTCDPKTHACSYAPEPYDCSYEMCVERDGADAQCLQVILK